MIDTAMSWIEVRAHLDANHIEQAWLLHYPLRYKIIIDRGNSFLAEYIFMMANDNSTLFNSISIRNLQVNTIVNTIGSVMSTLKVRDMDLDNENLWEAFLSSTMYAIQSKTHTTTQHILLQLVFGRDEIPNINQRVS